MFHVEHGVNLRFYAQARFLVRKYVLTHNNKWLKCAYLGIILTFHVEL
jgi:hypothetical protein